MPMMELPQEISGEDYLCTNSVISFSFSVEGPDLGNWRSALVEPRKNHNLGGTILCHFYTETYGNRQKIPHWSENQVWKACDNVSGFQDLQSQSSFTFARKAPRPPDCIADSPSLCSGTRNFSTKSKIPPCHVTGMLNFRVKSRFEEIWHG